MAKSRIHLRRRGHVATSNIQVVMSASSRLPIGSYLTVKGQRLMASATSKTVQDDIWKTYGKNRYMLNPSAVPIKKILHL